MQPKIDPIHRIDGVKTITGLSRSTIYRLMAESKFPPGIKLGERATGWRQSSLEAWLKSRESGV